MFAGQYGADLGAKAADARVPPWALFLAVQWLDVGWSILVLADGSRPLAAGRAAPSAAMGR